MSAARRAPLLGVVASGVALVGCFVVTGSTDGYQRAPFDAGAADADGAAVGLSLACLSAADCPHDAGAQICCLVPSSLTSAAAACQGAPCSGSFSVQLCKTSSECASASCISQQCAFAGATITLQACGSVPTCSPQ
jgi:hypothetical protein